MLGWGGGAPVGKGQVSAPCGGGICRGRGRKSSRAVWVEWGCGKGDARWSSLCQVAADGL